MRINGVEDASMLSLFESLFSINASPLKSQYIWWIFQGTKLDSESRDHLQVCLLNEAHSFPNSIQGCLLKSNSIINSVNHVYGRNMKILNAEVIELLS